jgi:hypothetical protein
LRYSVTSCDSSAASAASLLASPSAAGTLEVNRPMTSEVNITTTNNTADRRSSALSALLAGDLN